MSSNNFTNFFNTGDLDLSDIGGPILKPQHVIHKIDDCQIAQEIAKQPAPIADQLKTTQDLFRGKFPEYLSNKVKVLKNSDVPVLAYAEYLKELKDAMLTDGCVALHKLNRNWMEGTAGYKVGAAIVTNYTPGDYSVFTEVYLNNVHQKTLVYSLKEVIESLEKMGVEL